MKHRLESYINKNDNAQPYIRDLLFRFGYIASLGNNLVLSEALTKKLKKWRFHGREDLYIYAHPELNVHYSSTNGLSVIILGHVFNPFSKCFDGEVIANDLAKNVADRNTFLNTLDQLSGRYIIFAKFNNQWELYPDAFASKMRYFSTDVHGVVASHTTLLAEAIGAPLDLNMFSYITSDSYRSKDVKVLPGLLTEYQNIFVAPANHRLSLNHSNLERFWPRQNLSHNDEAQAKEVFVKYLDGYSDYIKRTFNSELFGLTGGMDSRTLLAPLLAKGIDVRAFTLLRGDADNKQDLLAAQELAEKFGFSHSIVDVSTSAVRNSGYYSSTRKVLRANGGPQRLNTVFANAALFKKFYKSDGDNENCNYSRGFGGEIIRGFYQRDGRDIQKAEPKFLASLTGIQSDQPFVEQCFKHFIDNLSYSDCYDADLLDIFYMEHRMSKWASNSLSETDITAHTMVGFNNRYVFGMNMGLPQSVRNSRSVFKAAINHFMPELMQIDIC